jgi:hypothetical protein
MVSPIGEKVARDVFERMWRSNDDGFGMLFRAREGVGIVKGIHAQEMAWEVYAQLPSGVPHVLHFRLATHGGVKPELTHPFVVSEDSPIVKVGVSERPVLAHNGVWSLHALKAKELRLKGPVSDTRVLAAWLGKLTKEKPLREVLRKRYYDVLSAGRVVVVDPATWRLHLVGDWIREGNFLFSNYSFREDLHRFPRGVCDWKWTSGADWPVLLAKEKARRAEPVDLEAIAKPEPVAAEVDEVEPEEAWPSKPLSKVRGERGLAVLRRSLMAVAAERGEKAMEAMRYVELDDYGNFLVAEGVVGMLEVEDEGYAWKVRLWSGARTKEARSRFLVANPVLKEFVRRETAVMAFLEETGIPPEDLRITSYEDVLGWGVSEDGLFVSPDGEELLPEEAAKRFIRETWSWMWDKEM